MLEEKIEALTKEVVLLRQALEKGGPAASAKPAGKAAGKAKPAADEDEDGDEEETKKPAAKKAAKPKADAPEHDEDDVGSLFRKAAKIDKPRCLKYLEKKECDDLADLLTKPELFDAAYAFAEKVIADGDDD